ncbi:hypothetical protein D9M72_654980 [compost metagenome]
MPPRLMSDTPMLCFKPVAPCRKGVRHLRRLMPGVRHPYEMMARMEEVLPGV